MSEETDELARETLKEMRRGRSFARTVLMIGCGTSLGAIILIAGCVGVVALVVGGASKGVSDVRSTATAKCDLFGDQEKCCPVVFASPEDASAHSIGYCMSWRRGLALADARRTIDGPRIAAVLCKLGDRGSVLIYGAELGVDPSHAC